MNYEWKDFMKAVLLFVVLNGIVCGQKFYPYLSYDRGKAGAGVMFDIANPKAMVGFGLAVDLKDEIKKETMSIYGVGINKSFSVRKKESDFEITFAYKINRAFLMAGIDLIMVKKWVEGYYSDWMNDGVYAEPRFGVGYITDEGFIFGASVYKDFLRGYIGYGF